MTDDKMVKEAVEKVLNPIERVLTKDLPNAIIKVGFNLYEIGKKEGYEAGRQALIKKVEKHKLPDKMGVWISKKDWQAIKKKGVRLC